MSVRQKISLVHLVVISILSLGLCVSVSAHEVADESTTVVHMYNDRYEPRDITVTAGDTVIFENVGEMIRWPASNIHPTHRGYPGSDIDNCDTPAERGMFDACREIEPGDTFTFTFEEVGTWPYHDHISAGITGTITVLPNTDVAPSQAWWQDVLDWFSRFIDWLFGNDGARSELTQADVDRVYDDTIPLATRTIATDIDALYSHVRKFGATATLAQLNALEVEYGSCHDNAHNVGRFTYELLGADAFKTCSMSCQSGCYHGAVEAYFREYGTANLASSINAICAASPNDFVLHQCRHGLGHGLMAWSNYQLFDALDGCDLLDSVSARSSCYSGVFMENIAQSMTAYLEIEGHTTEYISDDPYYPCSIVSEQYQANCYFLQTDRMLTLAEGDFATVVQNCSEVENDFSRQNCFLSLGRSASGYHRQRPESVIPICNAVVDTDNKQHCLTGAVQDTFWDEQGSVTGLKFCASLTDDANSSQCYASLFDRAPQVLLTADSRHNFCRQVPERYQEQCRSLLQ